MIVHEMLHMLKKTNMACVNGIEVIKMMKEECPYE